SKNGSNRASEDVAHGFGKLDGLITTLASRTAIDVTTGLLSRHFGLAALERDVLRARRTLLGRHCVAVLRLAPPGSANSTELIRLVADRLRSGLRREDLIFRNAEDELVCSFADMDRTDAWPILDRIKTELANELGYTPFGIGLTSLSPDQPADSLSRVEVSRRADRLPLLLTRRDDHGLRVPQGRTGLADRRFPGQIHASDQGRPSLQLGAGAPGRARQEGDARAGSRRVADGRPKRSGKP